MSLAGKVLRRGRSNTRVSIFTRDTATVVPRSRRRWLNRRSGGRRRSNGNWFRLLLLHWRHFSGGGMAEESRIVVERRRLRRRSRPHGAVEPFRHLLPHHFFLGIDWWIDQSIESGERFKFQRVSRRLSIRLRESVIVEIEVRKNVSFLFSQKWEWEERKKERDKGALW